MIHFFLNSIILISISNYTLYFECRSDFLQKKDVSSKTKEELFFNETIKIIIKNSDIDDEINGQICDIISNRVFNIVYNTNDSVISIEKKIDLIHILKYFQKSATKVYRGLIKDEIIKENEIIVSRPEFIIPLSICYYCDYSMIEAINIDDFEKNIKWIIPVDYLEFYESYIHIIRSVKSNKVSRSNNRTGRYSRFENINLRLVLTMNLRNKYEW